MAGPLGRLPAYPATHSLVGMLFGVSFRDGLAFGGSMAVLMVVAGFACYVPALRVSKVDPVIAFGQNEREVL